MNDRDWEVLHTLYRTKNITKTAKMLFLSQPTITSRLKRLEADFGVPLIIRKQHGITFTPEGRQLADYAKTMLREKNKITEKINNMKGMVTGTLRVGVSNFFALNKMPKLLRLFKKKYPFVECQVVTGWSSEMHRSVLNHDVHIGIIKGDYPWKGKKEILYEENICIAAPWDFAWKDLPNLPFIDYHTDENMRHLMDNWWYNNYQRQPYTTIQVNQVETCKEMIVNELGYSILANLVVRPHPNLIVRPIHDSRGQAITRKTWMYYHQEALDLNMVHAFTTFIRTHNVKEL